MFSKKFKSNIKLFIYDKVFIKIYMLVIVLTFSIHSHIRNILEIFFIQIFLLD